MISAKRGLQLKNNTNWKEGIFLLPIYKISLFIQLHVYKQHQRQKGYRHTCQPEHTWCSPPRWRGKRMPQLSTRVSLPYQNRPQEATNHSQCLLSARDSQVTFPSVNEIWRSEGIPFFSQSQDMQQRNIPSTTNLATSQWHQKKDRPSIRCFQKKGGDDKMLHHIPLSDGEASNKGGMLHSSTTILASRSFQGNRMGHSWMLWGA